MFQRFKQRLVRKVEVAQYQAIQLVSVRRSYLERRDKNRFRELVDIPSDIFLSPEQVDAATSHAKETLVVAGAGSGKTFVLVGRAKYLVGSGRAEPDKILLLAYNKAAAEELSTRTASSGIEVTAQTFHAFGNSVIKSPGERTGVAFGDSGEVANFLSKQLRSLDDDAMNALAAYFAHELVPFRPYEDFKSLNEYAAFVRASVPRTLTDQIVKSHGEWLIANSLYVHGIDFEYEALYDEGDTKDRHRPDFVIRRRDNPDIWIEYFGIDRAMSVAPGISQEGYLAGIQWKKDVHSRNSSAFIDLYFYDLKEETLLSRLESGLRRLGVPLIRRSPAEILEQANRIGYDSRFLKVCEQFLGHARAKRVGSSNLLKFPELTSRDVAFLTVFTRFLFAYETELEKRMLPDFAELIHAAADAIELGEHEFNFSHVLVDEFQDISNDRNRLLEAMKSANPKLELTCVGDDWQSIYRFSGSDIAIMREASRPRMNRKRVDLTATYRLPQEIADIARTFVLKNPLQLEKNVISRAPEAVPGKVVVHWDVEQNDHENNIALVISRIGKEAFDPGKSLRILARYANNLPTKQFIEEHWEGPIEISTIHSAKGLEADFVIVTDLVQDFRGFPSTIEDDPVMRLVMSEEDLYAHGEERRLFYVALTRARQETHLIAPASIPSLFAVEMLEDGLGIHVGLNDSSSSNCPACKSGRVLKSKNSGASYCSNIPLCDFIPPLCPECQKAMTYVGGKDRFECPFHPQDKYNTCRVCDWGVLVPRKYRDKRTGLQGEFLSCHTWPKTRCRGK